jgi:hypothetical protein
MTSPFVSQLRARGDVLQLAPAGAPAMTVRVEMPEVWDTVRASVSPTTPVAVLKSAALDALYPGGDAPDAFVMKLRGFEVLDESESLSKVGAVDGSIFLLTYRRRRPVR